MDTNTKYTHNPTYCRFCKMTVSKPCLHVCIINVGIDKLQQYDGRMELTHKKIKIV